MELRILIRYATIVPEVKLDELNGQRVDGGLICVRQNYGSYI